MSRSIYKPEYVHKALFEDCLNNKEKKNTKKIIGKDIKYKNIPRYLYFWAKHTPLNLNLVDKKISVYNGKVFVTLNVLHKVLGYKMGQFCITRKKPPHTGKQKQVKKVSRAHERMVAERKKIVMRGKLKKKNSLK